MTIKISSCQTQILVNINIDPHYSELHVAWLFGIITSLFLSLTFSFSLVAAFANRLLWNTFHELRHLIGLNLAEDALADLIDLETRYAFTYPSSCCK
jgi:hypothetical protein